MRRLKPFLRWAGGKTRLLNDILPLVPDSFGVYYEPFLGGGSVLGSLTPSEALISDVNEDLVLTYQVVRDSLPDLLERLSDMPNERDFYYSVRGKTETDDVARTARFLYLNWTCYNGLYRTNSKGEFNVPFGNVKKTDLVREAELRAFSQYLKEANVDICCCPFEYALQWPKDGDFVYLDPPYDPVSPTSSFTQYGPSGFGREEQMQLCNCCRALDRRGVKWLLSNSDSDFIKSLYADFHIRFVEVRRSIAARDRRRVREVLISNY